MKNLWPSALILFAASATAQAHGGGETASTFLYGLWHPLNGADHLLAMLAIGLLAANYGGRAVYTLPSISIVAVIAGALLGGLAIPIGVIDFGIVLSLVVLGLLLFSGRDESTFDTVLVIGALSAFYGYSHAAEGPLGGARFEYGVGFLAGTLLLQLVGIIGGFVAQWITPFLLRIVGVVVAAAGLLLGAALLN